MLSFLLHEFLVFQLYPAVMTSFRAGLQCPMQRRLAPIPGTLYRHTNANCVSNQQRKSWKKDTLPVRLKACQIPKRPGKQVLPLSSDTCINVFLCAYVVSRPVRLYPCTRTNMEHALNVMHLAVCRVISKYLNTAA